MKANAVSKHLTMRHYFYVFIMPAMVLYFIFFLFPFFQGIGYSFLNWNGIDPEIPNQMDEKKFSILIDYNLPLYVKSSQFQKKYLSKISDASEAALFRDAYYLSKDETDYMIKTDLSPETLSRLTAILKGIHFRGILSQREKDFIHEQYKKVNRDYILKNTTSIFKRSMIKGKLKRIGFENIRNVGFANFRKLASDPKFKEVISFTLFFTFFNVVLINLIGLLIALALDSNLRNRNLLRTMFFLPNILSLIIVAYIWSFIYREVFTALYNVTGWQMFSLNWLTDITKAPWAIVLTSVWQGIGYIMVIYLAGLQTIPSDILEAASIDGAGGVMKFFKITLPLLFPSMTICFFITLTNSLKTFEIMLALTDGGFRTTSFVLNIYLEAFRRNRVGYSTAQAIILLLVIMVISTIQLTAMKKKEIEY